MRRTLFAATLLALAIPARAEVHTVMTITDGDSITIPAGGTQTGFRLRLEGYDTPETNSPCKAEREHAQKAKARLAELARDGLEIVSGLKTERYGRILARAFTRDGESIALIMINERLARSNSGEARGSWCDSLGRLVLPRADQ
jgi:endonuclease YncB( thermonuclease family)